MTPITSKKESKAQLDQITIRVGDVRNVIRNTGCDQFNPLYAHFRDNVLNGSLLNLANKKVIADAIYEHKVENAAQRRKTDWYYGDNYPRIELSGIIITTAYTDDYSAGVLCESINKKYANRHGYTFLSHVLTREEIAEKVYPKSHSTWYKIRMLLDLFSNKSVLYAHKAKYVVWVDADAMIVQQNLTLESLIMRALNKDLIIGEDMNTGCLMNAGLFLLRVSDWSREFLEEVWHCPRYNNVTFYEQSTMARVLKQNGEGLELVQPFHSYLPDGPRGVKYFINVAVYPQIEFNTNIGVDSKDIEAFSDQVDELLKNNEPSPHGTVLTQNMAPVMPKPQLATAQHPGFVYHPAGMRGKMMLLYIAMLKYSLQFDLICCGQPLPTMESFRIIKGKLSDIQATKALTSSLLSKANIDCPAESTCCTKST